MSAINYVSKISVAKVIGKVKEEDNSVRPRALLRVMGLLQKYESGESDYGVYQAFLGMFKAMNVETGDQFVSGKLFVPGTITELLKGIVDSGNVPTKIAFEIGVKLSPDSQIGYEYTVKSLLETQVSLFDEIQTQILSLEESNGKAFPEAPTSPILENQENKKEHSHVMSKKK
jgi:hypothetical protein